MDRYVIKIPRSPKHPTATTRCLPKYKQTTITSLQRVVVVEDMERAKILLSRQNLNTAESVDCLEKLGKSIPSKEILLETKLGHVVNKLRKHKDTRVNAAATRLFKKWKQFYRRQKLRQPIEVRCDKQTEILRSKARRMIAAGLKTNISNDIVHDIERTVYVANGRSTNGNYKGTIRSLHLRLSSRENLRTEILNKTLSIEQLLKIL